MTGLVKYTGGNAVPQAHNAQPKAVAMQHMTCLKCPIGRPTPTLVAMPGEMILMIKDSLCSEDVANLALTHPSFHSLLFDFLTPTVLAFAAISARDIQLIAGVCRLYGRLIPRLGLLHQHSVTGKYALHPVMAATDIRVFDLISRFITPGHQSLSKVLQDTVEARHYNLVELLVPYTKPRCRKGPFLTVAMQGNLSLATKLLSWVEPAQRTDACDLLIPDLVRSKLLPILRLAMKHASREGAMHGLWALFTAQASPARGATFPHYDMKELTIATNLLMKKGYKLTREEAITGWKRNELHWLANNGPECTSKENKWDREGFLVSWGLPRNYLVKDYDKWHMYTVKMMIAHGVDMNAQDHYKMTPLHVAVKKGETAMVRVLLNAGCALLRDGDKRMPYDLQGLCNIWSKVKEAAGIVRRWKDELERPLYSQQAISAQKAIDEQRMKQAEKKSVTPAVPPPRVNQGAVQAAEASRRAERERRRLEEMEADERLRAAMSRHRHRERDRPISAPADMVTTQTGNTVARPSNMATAGPSTAVAAGPSTTVTAGPSTAVTAGPSTGASAGPFTVVIAGPSAAVTAGLSTAVTAGPSTAATAAPPTPVTSMCTPITTQVAAPPHVTTTTNSLKKVTFSVNIISTEYTLGTPPSDLVAKEDSPSSATPIAILKTPSAGIILNQAVEPKPTKPRLTRATAKKSAAEPLESAEKMAEKLKAKGKSKGSETENKEEERKREREEAEVAHIAKRPRRSSRGKNKGDDD